LPNGNVQVGVHIADVTHYVASGTALDVEAADRGTSTYLVEQRLDMLPKILTETLCSLRDDGDRFAFSVVWEMTKDGNILEVEFFKSIIRSKKAMSYDMAQLILDQGDADQSDLAVGVRGLNRLAKIFRQRRNDAGALTLASPEVRFVLDRETQNPTDVQMYQLKEANALVEEFMLLANITVAKKTLRHFPTLATLRCHPSPSKQQFESLIEAAAALDVEIRCDSSKHLAESLDAAVLEDRPYFNKQLRIMTTRCMMPAKYACPSPSRHVASSPHAVTFRPVPPLFCFVPLVIFRSVTFRFVPIPPRFVPFPPHFVPSPSRPVATRPIPFRLVSVLFRRVPLSSRRVAFRPHSVSSHPHRIPFPSLHVFFRRAWSRRQSATLVLSSPVPIPAPPQ
jgi:VacB/RNase II family 3'-5' exoribonuclease